MTEVLGNTAVGGNIIGGISIAKFGSATLRIQILVIKCSVDFMLTIFQALINFNIYFNRASGLMIFNQFFTRM